MTATTATSVLNIRETIKSAWEKVHGCKATFWKAMVLSLLIFGMSQLVAIQLAKVFPAADLMLSTILNALVFLFAMGFVYMGIKRAQKESFTWRALFKSFDGYTPLHLIALYLFQTCIVLIPFVIIYGLSLYRFNNSNLAWLILGIIILGGIFITWLYLRMMISTALVLDKGQMPWDAIKQSFKLTRGNVLRLFVLNIFQGLVLGISTLSVIGFIWGFPFCMILYGVIYMRLNKI